MRHANNLARGLGALIAVALFVVGVPIALITYVGWPLPTTLPTLDEIELALRSGINPQLLINTLAVIVWFTWAQLVIVFAAETSASFHGRSARRLPVLPGLQPAVAQLVAAVTLAVATMGPLRVAPAVATPLQAHVPANHATLEVADQPVPATVPDASSPRRTPIESPHPTHRIGRHDTLWQVAESTLGDGRRWQEIRDLNIGRIMADGDRFTETTDRLTPGWLLVLPDDAQTVQETDDTPDQNLTEITVESGDNFWTIAEQTLKTAWGRTPSNTETAGYWQQLVDANQHRLLPPHDPNLIYPDQRFDLPPILPDSNTEEPGETIHPNPAESQKSHEFTVERGDSFWSIAEETLAETWDRTPSSGETADYWHHVVDANLDRLLPPHDPNLIYLGQVLDLPLIPNDPQTPAVATTELDAAATPPEPVTTTHTPTTVTSAPDTYSLPPTTTTPTGDPALPYLLDEPASPPTSAVTRTPNQHINPHEPSNTLGDVPATELVEDPGDRGLADDLLPAASTIAGLGILAAGLVALLRRLRHTQLRHRRPDTTPTPPPPDTATTETTIRTAAAPTSAEFIDLALRSMAHDVTDRHIPPPEVVGTHLTPETLRILLWTPHHDPPTGWSVDDDGRSWTLPTDTDIDRLRDNASAVPAPYPALVTVGHGDRSQLLLDLEYLGATQLTGDPQDVVATCYTMATELATSAIADDIQIICVGFGHDLEHLERIHIVDQVEDTLPAVEAKTAANSQLVSTSPLAGRLAPGGDTGNPIVVFDPAADAPEEADRLLSTAHAGRGIAAVVGYPTGNRWRLHIDNNTVRIDPLGYTFARRNLTPTEQSAVADLVSAANDLEGMPTELLTPPDFVRDMDDETPAPTEGPAEQNPTADTGTQVTEVDTSPTPRVKVLGALRVDGPTTRFPLRKCTELVTYLTFHRNGVEGDTLMEALWPEQRPDYQRLNRHTSRARTVLGHGPDGQPYLPYVSDGIYRIGPHVQSDLEEFTRHIREARRASEADEVDHLRAALDLVEGMPFTGAGNAYTWAHTDGIITHSIVAVDAAAHRLAQIALHNGTHEQATWAARKGLTATRACEECYRNLMRAATAAGNSVALEAIYGELLAVVDADEGPDASTFLDPETIELYEQESYKHRRTDPTSTGSSEWSRRSRT